MSYARFGAEDSDVYVFEHVDGYLECCGCSLTAEHFTARDVPSFLAHLWEHDEDGDVVPNRTFERIREDWEAGIFAEWAAPPERDRGGEPS